MARVPRGRAAHQLVVGAFAGVVSIRQVILAKDLLRVVAGAVVLRSLRGLRRRGCGRGRAV